MADSSSVALTLRPYVCGGAAAMTAAATIHPIDLVKVRLQLLGEGAKGPKPSAFGVARGIIAADGASGLYAGLSASLMRQAVYGTARLGLYRSFSTTLQGDRDNLPFHLKAAASLSSGAIASAIGNPFDISLVRMQADTMKPAAERRHYKSVFDALIRITREEGIARLWRGATPTILRAMAMNFGMMASYDQIKESVVKVNGDRFSTQLISAAGAGLICSLLSLPLDLVKTRLQNMKPLANGMMPYTGVADCMTKILTREGLLSFWRGFGAYYGRSAPHAMIVLLTLEQYTAFYSRIMGL